MTKWVISDTHFFHRNIIDYCNRPFADIPQMNKVLIDNWNSVVRPQDIVYHLGDVGFGTRDGLRKIINQLNGIKYLTLGNHDTGADSMTQVGFACCAEEMVISGYRGAKILLRHHPCNHPPRHINVVVHGHIHNSDHRLRESVGEDGFLAPWNHNVSVEAVNYRPVSLDALVRTAFRESRVRV